MITRSADPRWAPSYRDPHPCYGFCQIFDHVRQRRIALSLDGGFFEGAVTYIYSVCSLDRFSKSEVMAGRSRLGQISDSCLVTTTGERAKSMLVNGGVQS
jgi:hypothetical protein